MADETVQAEQAEQTEQSEQVEVQDWEAKYREAIKHSRDWEKRAKENKEAADELERLRTEKMSETEKLTERAEKAEAELSRLTAETERATAAKSIAAETDTPAELLMFCADREAMEQFAALYKEKAHVSSAPKMQSSRLVRDSETPVSNREVFAEQMSKL